MYQMQNNPISSNHTIKTMNHKWRRISFRNIHHNAVPIYGLQRLNCHTSFIRRSKYFVVDDPSYEAALLDCLFHIITMGVTLMYHGICVLSSQKGVNNIYSFSFVLIILATWAPQRYSTWTSQTPLSVFHNNFIVGFCSMPPILTVISNGPLLASFKSLPTEK